MPILALESLLCENVVKNKESDANIRIIDNVVYLWKPLFSLGITLCYRPRSEGYVFTGICLSK